MEQNSETFLRKRKFLLALPVLVLPFLAMAFWALGGGKGPAEQSKAVRAGINTSLPGAKLKELKAQDKLSLYEQSRRDSAEVSGKGRAFLDGIVADNSGTGDGRRVSGPARTEASEAKIREKLAEIRRSVAEPETAVSPSRKAPEKPLAEDGSEAEKLRRLMAQMKYDHSAPDPELRQLEGMMDKILLIQHPENAAAMAQKDSQPSGCAVPAKDSIYKALQAVIDGNQKVVDGASVKLLLVDSVSIHGMSLASGQELYGLCRVTNQRLLLTIKKVRLGTSIIPVDLTVFDLDGMEGIRAKDAVTQDAMRSGAERAVQSLQLMSMDPSLVTQAADAGMEAAKSLFSRKVRRIKVKLKAGYPVLLRINRN